ncbi:MAG: (E)-4-hydroxy-3-methylbut-2-enyl-diphosphate synthase [Puniceicoccales bacterium]|jgi:(E)-4-hydroxy-3-methylbut-2-enyl-diphosphate synthase|nr:(E)-4-hydroxy-3-methylbut-2-enyl-diphosphate synthase [Puniceicoccales bacterium]
MIAKRRQTKEVAVGNVGVGGDNAISIQSMTNIPTKNVEGNVRQICELFEGGCEIIRLAVTDLEDVKFFAEIKRILRAKDVPIPMVADVHFSPAIALNCLEVADKVRINAGNFSDKLMGPQSFSDDEFSVGKNKLQASLGKFFRRAKDLKKSVRIGINHGSLAPRMVYKFGHTDMAMWESAKECLEVSREVQFENIILSFKASDAKKMIAANRLACSKLNEMGSHYPIHLGITESGNGDYARIKSAIGMGCLLMDGIGDTLRVSLTEDPAKEIEVAKNILQGCGARRYGIEFIACPSCGRTAYDIQSVLGELKMQLGKLAGAGNLKVAVMGCMVNGLGEAEDADFAIIGSPNGTLSLYQKRNCILKNVSREEICKNLIKIYQLKLDDM